MALSKVHNSAKVQKSPWVNFSLICYQINRVYICKVRIITWIKFSNVNQPTKYIWRGENTTFLPEIVITKESLKSHLLLLPHEKYVKKKKGVSDVKSILSLCFLMCLLNIGPGSASWIAGDITLH